MLQDLRRQQALLGGQSFDGLFSKAERRNPREQSSLPRPDLADLRILLA